MSFFAQNQANNDKRIYVHFAKELYQILKNQNKARKWSLSKWSNQIRLMIEKDKVPFYEIQNMLDWYESRGKHHKRPFICNATHFRTHFSGWLSDLRSRDIPEQEIEEPIMKLSKRLTDLQWPKGSETQLPVNCQILYNRFMYFSDKIKNYISVNYTEKVKRIDKNTTEVVFTGTPIAKILKNLTKSLIIDSPVILTEFWMKNIHNKVAKWDKWSGKIEPFLWDGNLWDEEFLKFIVHVTKIDYFKWEEIIKELTK